MKSALLGSKEAPEIVLRGFLNMATLVGLEPMTSAVTGRRSNQLSYSAIAKVSILDGGHGWD